MKTLLLTTALAIVLFSCDQRPNHVVFTAEDQLEWAVNGLGLLADSTYTDSIDVPSIMAFKAIDLKGAIRKIEMKEAMELYMKNRMTKEPELYPIFEVKHSSTIILPVFGEGLWDRIWGEVVVNKENLEIIDIKFDHRGETPGMGDNIREPAFKSQFVGRKIDLTKNSFALYQGEQQVIEGAQKIDGISGATITSKGAIDMLNQGLLKYKDYLIAIAE